MNRCWLLEKHKENKKYDFAGNEKFMLEYCRVMLNKDIATMQRETNAYKKKVADTFGEDVCAALLAICSYRYGRKDADFEELAESVKSLFTSTQANELCSVGQIIFHTACAYATKIDFTKFFSKEWFENFFDWIEERLKKLQTQTERFEKKAL